MLGQHCVVVRDPDYVIDAMVLQGIDANVIYCGLSRLESNVWNGKLLSRSIDNGSIEERAFNAGVSTLDFSTHSNFLLAGRDDGIISFHSPDLSDVARIHAHTDLVVAVSAHTSASQCVSGGWDGRLALWDWSADGNPLIEKVDMHCQYRDVAYNTYANCSVVSTVGNDGFLRLWDPRNLKKGCTTMFNLQQMGTCCSWASEYNLVIGLENGTVLGYDIRQQCMWEQRVSDTTIRRIGVNQNRLAAASEDGAVTVWTHGGDNVVRNVIHGDYITDLLWHRRGILTSSVDKSVVLSSFVNSDAI